MLAIAIEAAERDARIAHGTHFVAAAQRIQELAAQLGRAVEARQEDDVAHSRW